MGHSLASLLRQAYQFTSGCTEPAAIGLNAAIAGYYLGEDSPDSFEIEIDLLTYKNAYNAGIPNGVLTGKGSTAQFGPPFTVISQRVPS